MKANMNRAPVWVWTALLAITLVWGGVIGWSLRALAVKHNTPITKESRLEYRK